ncbi:MAG: hypothetical protein QME81_15465 [bacterium]|nr:hypothetical protein [bacterium]
MLTRQKMEESFSEVFPPEQAAVLAEVMNKIRVAVIIERSGGKNMSTRLTRQEMEEKFLRVFSPEQSAVLAEVLDVFWDEVIDLAAKYKADKGGI